MHLLLADLGRGPRIMADEAGYLANAIYLATGDIVPMEGTAFYSGGYSLLLTPFAWWFGDDRLALYRSAAILQAALAAVVVLVMSWTVRRVLDVDRSTALVAAIVAGLTPALVMHTGLSWAESSLTCAVVVAFALVARALSSERSSSWPAELVRIGLPAGIALGAVAAIHRRGLAPAAVVLLVLAAWTLVERRGALLGGAIGGFVAVMVASRALDAHLLEAVWSGHAADLQLGAKASGLRTWSGASATGAAATGQVWYLLVASAGLVGLAVVAGVDQARSLTQGRRAAWQAWFGLAMVGAIGALLAVGALFVGTATHQAEYLVYGRYPEMLAPLFIGVGFAWALTAARSTVLLGAGAVAVVTFGSWAVVSLLNRARLEQSLNRVVVPGVIDWFQPDAGLPPLLRGTIAAVVVGGSVVLVGVVPKPRGQHGARLALAAALMGLWWGWQLTAIRDHIVLPLRTNAAGADRLADAVRGTGADHLGLEATYGRGVRAALALRLPGTVVAADDGEPCTVLVPAAAVPAGLTVLDTVDTVAIAERPPPCRR